MTLDLKKGRHIYTLFCSENEHLVPPNMMPKWLDAVCEGGDWSACYFEKNGIVSAVWPFFIKKKKGMAIITEPKFTQNCGPIIIYPQGMQGEARVEYEKKVLSEMAKTILSLDIDYIRQHFPKEIVNWLPLYWLGFQQTSLYTYINYGLYGKTGEEILASFSKDARKTIRKILKNGYTYEIADEGEFDSIAFYKLHKECLANIHKTISFSQDLLTRMMAYARENNSGKTVVIKDKDNNIVAATFFIYNKYGATGINTAANHNIKGLGYLCHYACMCLASSFSDSFNTGGSMIEGVEKAYRQFGTSQTPYFSISKSISKKFRLLDIARQFLNLARGK